MKYRNSSILLTYVGTIATVLLVWGIYVKLSHVSSFMLPSPLHVYFSTVHLIIDGQLTLAVGQTLFTLLLGYGLGILGGFSLAVVLFRSPFVEKMLGDILVFIQTAPKIALAPLFILWFGLGFASKLLLVVSLVFFPVLIATLVGFRMVSREFRELAALLQLSGIKEMRNILLPLGLPSIFDGLKVALVQGVIGAIIAEWMSGNSGLGYLMEWADTTYHIGTLLSAISMTIMLGVVLNGMLVFMESHLLAWHQSQKQETNRAINLSEST